MGDEAIEIHIFIKKNGKKHITFIEGMYLLDDNEIKDFHEFVLKKMKKKFSCNGAIKTNDENKKYMQLSGDQRECIRDFLLENFHIEKESIKIHGF